jgi:hypothetical protein
MQVKKFKLYHIPLLIGAILILAIVFQSFTFILNQKTPTSNYIYKINLNNLFEGSSFEGSENISLNLPEKEKMGVNMSRLLVIPYIVEPTENYSNFISLFASLYMDINLDGNSYTFEVISPSIDQAKGVCREAKDIKGWKYEKTEYTEDKTWYFSTERNDIFLNNGVYGIILKTYGITSNPTICKYAKFFVDELIISFRLIFEFK